LYGPHAAPTLGGMPTTLITGANMGLGREAARRLLELCHDVWIAARDPDRVRAAAADLGARFVQLDVTDDVSVARAADRVEAETGLDVLVNNPGITGEDLREVYDTNVFGVVRVFHAFAPLLERSEHSVVVNVSSGVASLAVTSDPERIESTIVGLAYPSSKTAVNMLTSQLAKAYPWMRINAVDPGYTATDLNGHSGVQSVQERTDAIVRMATVDGTGPTGAFIDRHGTVPW
jgi:NAD(P)-dependent dehydrogenase (short-subunit alcohol dehydrogenase family)